MLSEEIDQQQQQHIIDLLVAADVFPDTAAALAVDPWVTPTRISRWLADLTAKRQEGIVRCVGAVLASNLRRHREPPRPPDEEDRRRYISGEYADYIEH